MKLFTEPDFVGYSEVCGIRDEMEDAIIARPGIVAGNDIYAVLQDDCYSRSEKYDSEWKFDDSTPVDSTTNILGKVS